MGDHEIAKSTSLDAHLNMSPPSCLYHYTTQSGLLGILSGGGIHASKAQYLNDATDFWLAIDITIERINHWKSQAAERVPAGRFSELVARLANTVITNVFVACFCENGDLLSQWRGYSGGHYGYSIGMETSRLILKARESQFELGKCIYDREIQRRIIDELIGDSVENGDRLGTDQERAAAFERGLLRAAAFFKHETFREEQEWRIVSSVTAAAPPEIGFQMGVSMPTPYLAVPIGTGSDSPIHRAYLGPCPHPLLAKAALAMIFAKQGLRSDATNPPHDAPNISNSSIPF